ncbi:MAG: hypothetical protein KAW90_00260 [Dehalococcoidales bacterium]|nr:hypothetical protein [Dehalococcoidales bacterium]
MAVKHKILYLYLALACFLGIILIFIFDGYIGVYDSLEMTSGEFPRIIEPDQWPEDEKYEYYSTVDVQQSGSIAFTYKVQNRTFSTHSADVEVTVSHEQEQVAVLLSQPLTVASFDEGQLEWVLVAAEFVPADFPSDQRYDLSVLIKKGDVERYILVYIRGDSYPPKIAIPEPTR